MVSPYVLTFVRSGNIHGSPTKVLIEEITLYKSLFTEFCNVFAWSYEEMPSIDPRIVVHEIKTYAGAKPVRQKLCQIHPKKEAAIKAEVEKLLRASFIYPVPLTEWVSNIMPVTKE